MTLQADSLAYRSARPVAEARRQRLRMLRAGEAAFHTLTLAAAVIVLAAFGGIVVALVYGAAPAFAAFGAKFLIAASWNPVTQRFGALASIYGTLVTAAVALAIAAPVGLFIAVFLTEVCPRPLRRPIGIAVELLAAIPSIIYGMWGLFVLAPFMQVHVQPVLIGAFAGVPLLGALFAGPPYGIGILTAGLVLAIMVLPFVTAIARDALAAVPTVLKEAAYGLGATTWEVVRHVALPRARVGIVGAIMLGLGRALGETMAVTFVVGNSHRITGSLLAPGATISSTIANEFAEASGDLYTSTLIALALVLFAITFSALAISRALLARTLRRAGEHR